METVFKEWEEFNKICTDNNLTIFYDDDEVNYSLYAKNDLFLFRCIMAKDRASDFERNKKDSSTSIVGATLGIGEII